MGCGVWLSLKRLSYGEFDVANTVKGGLVVVASEKLIVSQTGVAGAILIDTLGGQRPSSPVLVTLSGTIPLQTTLRAAPSSSGVGKWPVDVVKESSLLKLSDFAKVLSEGVAKVIEQEVEDYMDKEVFYGLWTRQVLYGT